MRPVRLTRLWLLPAVIALGLALTAAPASAAAKCKKHSGQLGAAHGNRVWHKGSTLYACEPNNFASGIPQVKIGFSSSLA